MNMSLPQREHNSLIATREFLKLLIDEVNVPEKIKLSAQALLKNYPERSKIDQLYSGNTFSENISSSVKDQSLNKTLNNNQTWDTPGFKWKTEVEFISRS